MSESKLVSSSSLKLLILVLVGAFVLASSSTATAQLGFPVTDIAPANSADQTATPSGWGHDKMMETADGTLYYFHSWFGRLYYSASIDGGTTWTDHELGKFPTTASEDRLNYGQSENQQAIVEGNSIHTVSFYYDGLHPNYGYGVFYSELTSNGTGKLTKVGVLNRNITGPVIADQYEMIGACLDSQGRVMVGWHNFTNRQIEFYRSSDGTSWDKFTFSYVGSGLDLRAGEMRMETIFNDSIRVTVVHNKVAETSSYYISTFTLDNGATWDSSQINYVYSYPMAIQYYFEATAVSDAGDWLHIIAKSKATDEYYHAIIAQGSLLSNTIWRSNTNITQIAVRSFGTQQLLAICLLYTSPSPRDGLLSRMPSSA